jgi:uncharacterized repeat protein (TIGR02543 family)
MKNIKLFGIIVMAVCVTFAMISCDTGTSPKKDKEEKPVAPGQPVTIRYDANGWTGSNIPEPKTGKSGEVIGAEAIPILTDTETQKFLGWSLAKDGDVITANYELDRNITLYVRWQQKAAQGEPVTITYNANGWTGDIPGPRTVQSGAITNDNLPVLPNTETQIFYGWSATPGQAGTRLTASYRLESNITLYVLYKNPVIISFDYNFTGAPAAPASVTVAEDVAIGNNVLPVVPDSENPVAGKEPIRQGWLFQGWFTEKEAGTKVTTSSKFTTSTTLYAQWKAEPAWAYIDLDLRMLAETETADNGSWPSDMKVAKAEFDANGLVWTFDQSGQRGMILFSPKQRAILDKIDDYRLIIDGTVEGTGNFRWFIGWIGTSQSWNADGGSGESAFDSIKEMTISFGVNKLLDGSQEGGAGAGTQDTRTGAWIIQHRTSGVTTVLKIKSIRIRYDSSIGGEAPAKDTAIKISFDRSGEAGAPVNPLIIDKGGKITDVYWPKPDPLPVITSDTATFLGWYTGKNGGGDKIDANNIGTKTFDNDTTLYANWEAKETVTVTYDMNGATGVTAPAPAKFAKSTAIGAARLPGAKRDGYYFLGWYKENTGTTEILPTTVFDNDDTIYAKWEQKGAAVTIELLNKDSANWTVNSANATATWDENALVVSRATAFGGNNSAADIVSLPIPRRTDLNDYASLEFDVDLYVGDTKVTAFDQYNNDLSYRLFNGVGNQVNLEYNAGSGGGFIWTLSADQKAADFSGGQGRVVVVAMSKTNAINKIVVRSVKFVVGP